MLTAARANDPAHPGALHSHVFRWLPGLLLLHALAACSSGAAPSAAAGGHGGTGTTSTVTTTSAGGHGGSSTTTTSMGGSGTGGMGGTTTTATGGMGTGGSGGAATGPVLSLVSGDSHTCALLSGGHVKCWGGNGFGQLGLGDTKLRGDGPGQMGADLPTVDLGSNKKAVAIAAGVEHTCALLDDGHVKCWGANSHGELGQGDTNDRGDEPGEMGDALPAVDLGAGKTALAISAGNSVTCALLNGGAVKCWGRAGYLGLGDLEDHGDEPGEMGDALPPVDLGSGKTATAISTGGGHTCAVLSGGSVKCWGDNFYGELGLGDRNDRGDEPGEMGDQLPAVDLGSNVSVVTLAAGFTHTCVLLNDGHMKCWGNDDFCEIGLGVQTFAVGDQPNEMGDALPPVDVGSGQTVVALAPGISHTCAILSGGRVKCWGFDGDGQLGLGETSPMFLGCQPTEMGDGLPFVDLGTGVVAVAAVTGNAHSCALLSDGGVKCWGRGGEIGLGDANARGDGPGEMGDSLPEVALW